MFVILLMLLVTSSVQVKAKNVREGLCRDITQLGSDVVGLIIDDVTDISDVCSQRWNISIQNATVFGVEKTTYDPTNFTEEELSKDAGNREKKSDSWKTLFKKIQYFITGVYFPCVATLSVIGNGIVLSVLCKDALQSSSSVYVQGLAAADVIFAISYSPKTLSAFDTVKASRAYQTFRAFQISYFFPLVNVGHTAAVWIIISFTLERYIAVAWPLSAHKYVSKHRARMAVIAAFVFGMVLNGVRFFRRRVVPKNDPVTNETYFSYTFTDFGRDETVAGLIFWSYFLLAEMIPFLTLFCLNLAIMWNVWLAHKKRLTLAGNNDVDEKNRNYRETQITRMLICIVTAFLLCNAVAGAASIWVALNGPDSLYTTQSAQVYYMFEFSAALYMTNPLVNCILYAACSSTIRKGIKSKLCFTKRHSSPPTSRGVTSTTVGNA